MKELLRRLEESKKNILVVGDIILDKYIYGSVERISPEAPIPVLCYEGERVFPGGAANVAANIAALGARAFLLSATGDDAEAGRLCSILSEKGIDISGIFTEKGRKTTQKTRMVSRSNQQLLRVDDETPVSLSCGTEEKIKSYFDNNIDRFDIVMISDYNKGVVTASLCRYIIEKAARKGKKVLVDPKSPDYLRYRGAYLIKPNRKELATIFGCKNGSIEEMAAAILKVKRELQTENFVVTLGDEGMLLADSGDRIYRVRGKVRQVFDVTGAGDTSFAAMGVCIAHGGEIRESLEVANIAAGLKVQKDGVAEVTLEEVMREYEPSPAFMDKILRDRDSLRRVLNILREQRKTIVFTNGCFDLLHYGHVSYLSKARNSGDVLIVGVNSDNSVRRIKGESRPIVSQENRMRLLAALEFVDYVVLFDEDTPARLIEEIQPDVLVKGADWKPDQVVGRETVEAKGGRVELIPLEEGLSTTGLIKKIVESYKL